MNKPVLLNYYKNAKSSYKIKLFYEILQYFLKIYKNKGGAFKCIFINYFIMTCMS